MAATKGSRPSKAGARSGAKPKTKAKPRSKAKAKVKKDEWITREQLLDRYDIQEATLTGAEDNELLSVVEVDKNARGYLTYRITEQTDLLFRVLRVFPFEISNAKARLLPMHRAFLFYAIRGGLDEAIRIMQRRSILAYPKQDLLNRWNLFLRRVPKEALPFIKGQTSEWNDAITLVCEILEVREAFEDPDILIKLVIFNDFRVRGMVDGLLQVGTPSARIAKLMQDLKNIDIQAEHIREYKHFYYDPQLLTPADVRNYCNKIGRIAGYTDAVLAALDHADDVYDYISSMGWVAEMEYEEEMKSLLRTERKRLMQKAVGKESKADRNRCINNVIRMVESMHNYRQDTGDEVEDNNDLLRLRRDAAINNTQLTMEDIDAEDLDGFDASSEKQAAGDTA